MDAPDTRPAVNGRSAEWAVRIGMLVASVLAAYYTAQNTTDRRLTTVETTERLHYEATQGSLQDIKDSLLRQETRWEKVLDDYRNGVDRRTGEPLPLQRSIEERAR